MNVSNMRLSSGIVFGMLTIVLVACGSMPNSVSAAVIVSQTLATTSTGVLNGAGNELIVQRLGTGLSGTVANIGLSLSSSTPYSLPQILLVCWTDAYSTLCDGGTLGASSGISSSTVSISTSQSTYFFVPHRYSDYTSLVTLNSSNYYSIQYQNGGGTKIYGAGSNSYANGYASTNGGQLNNLGDIFFVVNGSGASVQSTGITSVIRPTYGQVVASGDNVEFNFNYYVSSLAYDKAGFTLVDNTAFQSINVSALEETINASGARNFIGYFDLVTGHNYSWTPYLRNSTTGARVNASSTTFFVGSQSNQSIPNVPPPLWNGCTNILCQGATHGTTTGLLTWNGGTTTTPFGPFGMTLDDLLAQKAPFSYLYDIKQVLYELANGNGASPYNAACTSQDAYYTLPTGSMGTVLANGSTTVKIIDACAVKAMSPVVYIRQTITYALYLVTGLGLASMALGIL